MSSKGMAVSSVGNSAAILNRTICFVILLVKKMINMTMMMMMTMMMLMIMMMMIMMMMMVMTMMKNDDGDDANAGIDNSRDDDNS